MDRPDDSVDRVAADTGFSGVVRVDRDGEVALARAYGLAHRGWGVANTVDTRFAIASGTKGLTALTVVDDYVLSVPVHELATTEQYLRVLDGYPTSFAPGARFAYNNGGVYTTAADVHALWAALFDGRIVSAGWVEEMARPHSEVPSASMRYGLGFWLHASRDTVMLEGADAGVSFRTVHDPAGRLTHTVLSNTSDGAWPVTRRLDALLGR